MTIAAALLILAAQAGQPAAAPVPSGLPLAGA